MEFDLKFDYAEALRREDYSQSQIDAMRISAKKSSIVPKSLTNKQVCARETFRCAYLTLFFPQLFVFLQACDGDIDKAKQMLEKHYEIRRKAPQLFTQRYTSRAEIRQCLENQYYVNLPPTPENHLVCFHGLANTVAKNYNYDPATTCFLMMIRKFEQQASKCIH